MLLQTSDLIADDPILVKSHSTSEAQVSLPDFRSLVSALEDKQLNVKNDNIKALSHVLQ
jgi:hypothetical protein